MANDFYVPSGYPAPNAPGASASMRGELDLIESGFDKLPTLTGNGDELVVVNSAGTALVTEPVPAGGLVGLSATQVLTNKTLNLASNTLAGTIAQFNVALTDGNFATLAGTETLINKTINLDSNTLSGTIAHFNAALSDGDFATLAGTESLSNKTINGGSIVGAAISGLSTPTNPGDAASKSYVDSVAEGLDAKASCRAATTANITLSGTQTIDGVALIAGDRVLVKDQSTASANGIYVVAAGSWARSGDANAWTELVSAFTFIEQGSVNVGNGYICTVAPGGTLGSTSITFSQFSSAGQLQPGAGLTRTGNTLDVATASSARIVVNADSIDLATTAVTPGTYKSLTVDAYGRATAGTNPTTLAGYGITDAYTSTYIDTLYGSTASAAASAAAAAASYDAFDDRWLGAKASDPSVDNDGNALVAGAVYFSTTLAEMRVYTGSAWQTATSLPSGVFQKNFTATPSQVSYVWTGGSYAPGALYIYVNGILLSTSEYTATDGTNITFVTALTSGDDVRMVTFKAASTITLDDIDATSGSAYGVVYLDSSAQLKTGTFLAFDDSQKLFIVNGVWLWRGGGGGGANTGVGANTLLSNTSGTSNTAIGSNSLRANLAGWGNVAVGDSSLYSNTSGEHNCSVGMVAMQANTSGSNNAAFGYGALYANTSGSQNSAFGTTCLTANTTGLGNAAFGESALAFGTTGSYNTALGTAALLNATTGSGNIVLGSLDSAGAYVPVFNVTSQNNRLVAGTASVTNAYVQVAWTVVSDARDKADFAQVPHGLDFINALQPVAYRYKKNRADVDGHGPLRYGFRAQDVLELEGDHPVVVDAEDPEKLRMVDTSLIPILVQAVQQLTARVRLLEDQLKA